MPAWRDIVRQGQLADLLREEGCLYLYRENMPAKDMEWSARLRTEMGIRQRRLTAAEVAEMEPALPPVAGGLFFPDAAHINDPAALSRRMAAKLESLSASFQRARVERLEPQSDGKIRLTCDDRFVEAHSVVLPPAPGRDPWPCKSATKSRSTPSVAITSNSIWMFH
jgi:D-hydroxyproline dehydrogenase